MLPNQRKNTELFALVCFICCSAAFLFAVPYGRGAAEILPSPFAISIAMLGCLAAFAVRSLLCLPPLQKLIHGGFALAFYGISAYFLPFRDELFHLATTLALILSSRAAAPLLTNRPAILAAIASLLVASLEELLQRYVPGRVFDLRDLALNCSGVCAALVLCGYSREIFLPHPIRGTLLSMGMGSACLAYALFGDPPVLSTPGYSLHPQSQAQPNLVLLTIDSMRPDHMSLYGYARKTTPVLDALAEQCAVFSNAHATSGWTSPGVVSVLTGLYPLHHGVMGKLHQPHPNTPSIARLLSVDGYVVPNISYLTSLDNYNNLGFPGVDQPLEQRLKDDGAKHLAQVFLDNLPPSVGSFFLWHHYRFLHLPYTASPDAAAFSRDIPQTPLVRSVQANTLIPHGSLAPTAAEQEAIEKLYDDEVLLADRSVGTVVEALKKRGLWDATYMAITADHGEELFDHGSIGHASTNGSGHLYEEILRIPLVICGPGIAKRRVSTLVRQIDIAPTLLSLLGKPTQSQMDGISLAACVREGNCSDHLPLYAETIHGGYQAKDPPVGHTAAFIAWPKKLIEVSSDGASIWECYDLVEDPGEQRFAICPPEQLRTLRSQRESHLEKIRRQTFAP